EALQRLPQALAARGCEPAAEAQHARGRQRPARTGGRRGARSGEFVQAVPPGDEDDADQAGGAQGVRRREGGLEGPGWARSGRAILAVGRDMIPLIIRRSSRMSDPVRSAALAVAAGLASIAVPAAAQQVAKPPIAQYWVDVATHGMAGMPEMPGMPALPSFMGAGQGGAGNQYGNARGMAPGRWLDLALYTRNKPSGSEATHAIPAGMQLGASLPLVPVTAQPRSGSEPGEVTEEPRERPTGRLLIYWGCGETVRAGQPRVIDLAGDVQAFGRAFAGRYAPDRGARVAPGYSLWPNDRHRELVPRGASLAGEHAIRGDGVPASMKFAIGQAQDFMPAIQLASSGALADSIALQWPAVPHARAYYLHAMASDGKD